MRRGERGIDLRDGGMEEEKGKKVFRVCIEYNDLGPSRGGIAPVDLGERNVSRAVTSFNGLRVYPFFRL